MLELLNIILRILVIALLSLFLIFTLAIGATVLRIAYKDWQEQRRLGRHD